MVVQGIIWWYQLCSDGARYAVVVPSMQLLCQMYSGSAAYAVLVRGILWYYQVVYGSARYAVVEPGIVW